MTMTSILEQTSETYGIHNDDYDDENKQDKKLFISEENEESSKESKTDSLIDKQNNDLLMPMEIHERTTNFKDGVFTTNTRNYNNTDTKIQILSDIILKTDDKNLCKPTISLPASSPSLSLSSYYSSAESVSSDTGSKKKKKRHCHTCDTHFKHTRDLLKHLKIHVSLPMITVTKLSENDVAYKKYLERQKEIQLSELEANCNSDNGGNNSSNNSSGSLKLKLKLSGSQNFEVVPIDKKSPSPVPPSSSAPIIEENTKKGISTYY